MLKIKIQGGFNDGLTAKLDTRILLFSDVMYKWFKPDLIHIHDQYKTLQLTIKHSKGLIKTTYNITYQIDRNDNYIKSIKDGLLEFNNGKRVLFKKNFFNLISNPYSKIYYENKKIGHVNWKRLKLFGLDFTLFLDENSKNLLGPILTYLLITESNNNRDDGGSD